MAFEQKHRIQELSYVGYLAEKHFMPEEHSQKNRILVDTDGI